jgi:rubrerythrin
VGGDVLSARSIFEEIRSNDEAYRLFLSIAAKGEEQGGWENERIAALTEDAELRPKIARHGEDEHKHGRLFQALLKKRGLDPVRVPDEADYCMLLERAGIGLAHERLHQDRPLSEEELLAYLVHSRVTEQRASEEIELQRRIFRGDPELGRAVEMIAEDEVNHLAYCHEELLRFAERGHRARIEEMLREYARVEIRAYRDVSLAVMGRFGETLGWSRPKRGLLALGIRAVYCVERLFTWRRMTRLRMPERRNAMAPRGRATASAAG